MNTTNEVQKTPFILAPRWSREELKSHPCRRKGPFYRPAHHRSPPQTLDGLQVADVPYKTRCPELSTDSRQGLIGTVSRGIISSSHLNTLSLLTEPKIVGVCLTATSRFCVIRSLCPRWFSYWLLKTQISTSFVCTFYILKSKFISVNSHGVGLSPGFDSLHFHVKSFGIPNLS